jgi:hypothetical protein
MNRERLPNRRTSRFFEFEAMEMRFTAGVSRFPDGRIAEVFLDNHKAGSAIGTLVRDAAIILSFALQHGADIEAIRRALGRNTAGQPLGRSALHSTSLPAASRDLMSRSMIRTDYADLSKGPQSIAAIKAAANRTSLSGSPLHLFMTLRKCRYARRPPSFLMTWLSRLSGSFRWKFFQS